MCYYWGDKMVKLEYELRDGNHIPALGLGTWALRGSRCTYIVKRAIELGYKHIDTADAYGNHEEIGSVIKNFDRSMVGKSTLKASSIRENIDSSVVKSALCPNLDLSSISLIVRNSARRCCLLSLV